MDSDFFGGRYLDDHYPVGFQWVLVTTAISVLLCIYLPYRFLVFVIKSDAKKESGD